MQAILPFSMPHSLALANAVYNNADITFIVMDNSWTCMTGHQPNPTTGENIIGNDAPIIEIVEVVKSLEVKDIHISDAYDIERTSVSIKDALNFKGPSVVVVKRECALQVQRRKKIKNPLTYVDTKECIGCKKCIELGCPAVTFNEKDKKAGIDKLSCVDCGLCRQVCPVGAIKVGEEL